MLSAEQITANIARMHDKIAEDVEKHGFSSISVFGDKTSPSFTYTIGLGKKGLPDIIVFGIPQQTAHQLIWNVVNQLPELPPFAGGIKIDKVIQGYECALVDVSDNSPFETHMIQAATYYRRQGIEQTKALQMVWPDKAGKLPGMDDDCDPAVVLVQLGWTDAAE